MAGSRLAVAVLLGVATTAHAGDARVHSFAYITGVQTDYATSADEGVKENRCDITARLPVAILEEAPKGKDDALLTGATLVGERVKDPNRNCDDYLHTWQPVDFDPAKRDDVHFRWPHGDPDTGQLIIGGVIVVLIGGVIIGRVRDRWRLRRRRHRHH